MTSDMVLNNLRQLIGNEFDEDDINRRRYRSIFI